MSELNFFERKNEHSFVERGTHYPFKGGLLTVYETNCPCKGITFDFENYMLTLMLSGHKTVTSATQVKVEFFPGTLFIPEKSVKQSVDIPNASFNNPTQCLVLEISPTCIGQFIDVINTQGIFVKNYNDSDENKFPNHFLSNDTSIVETFTRFYNCVKYAESEMDELISLSVLKELMLRLFKTQAGYFLVENYQSKVQDTTIEAVTRFIKTNLTNKITIDNLIDVSGFSKTKLFNRFKDVLGCTPVAYILKERINHSKMLLLNTSSLQSVATLSGFHTYEHFCKSFKKIEGVTPNTYKKRLLSNVATSF